MNEFLDASHVVATKAINKDVFIFEEGELVFPYLNDVVLYMCRYDNKFFHDVFFTKLKIVPSEQILKSVQKRKAEYIAGRYCAQKALERFDIYNFEVKSDKSRCPLWPLNILGAITHTSNCAISAVARDKDYRYIGIDYEELMDVKTANTLGSKIINIKERELILSSKISFDFAVTLVFSAKESLFKALFPLVKKYFGFDAVEILNYSTELSSFTLRLSENLSDSLIKGRLFNGHFRFSESHVLTIIAE